MSARLSRNRIAFGASLTERTAHAVRGAAFWAAIVSPVGYPFLLYAGLDGRNALLFVGLLAANGLALAVGHDYDPGSADGTERSGDARPIVDRGD
jgi:hypothetical protein